MPKFHVTKTIGIDAPVEKVYQNVSDLSFWKKWSPWLILDPKSEFNLSEDHKSYSWKGPRMGSGEMKVTDEKAPHRVSYDLKFLTPFKSRADVWINLETKDGGTEVTWSMDSSLPWFLFFMTKMMTAYLGMDFWRGLLLLKDLSETGEIHSRLEFKGKTEYPGCTYIGLKTSCSIDEVGSKMSEDFSKLSAIAQELKDAVSGKAFSIYHRWDVVRGRTTYTAAVPVKTIPAGLPAGIVSGEIPATPVNTVRHTGPYLHLGNAWGAQYSMQRNKEFKFNKKIDPFEVYENMPGEVPEKDLVTDVHFSVK